MFCVAMQRLWYEVERDLMRLLMSTACHKSLAAKRSDGLSLISTLLEGSFACLHVCLHVCLPLYLCFHLGLCVCALVWCMFPCVFVWKAVISFLFFLPSSSGWFNIRIHPSYHTDFHYFRHSSLETCMALECKSYWNVA